MNAITGRRGLYAILDPDFCRGRDPFAVAEAILEGGCAVLQLRAKRGADDDWIALAHALQARCARADVPFVVNDRVELALRTGAAGLHLGQTDMPIEQARELCGPAVAIGVSTHDLPQARAAAARGADLIGYGPVFATGSKPDASPVVGLAGLRDACAAVAIPVVGIGGLGEQNAKAVAEAGAPLGAAISAVCGADDPRTAAARLHAALTSRHGSAR